MIEEKLVSLGLTLPGVPKPAGSYIPSLRINDLVFISGQVPFIDVIFLQENWVLIYPWKKAMIVQKSVP